MTTTAYLTLKDSSAPKLGKRAHGKLHYRWLTNDQRSTAYFVITGNDGGGCFSNEVVPFDAIRDCLSPYNAEEGLPAHRFLAAFKGRSANNAGFLVAALYQEGLLCHHEATKAKLHPCSDWQQWLSALMELPPKDTFTHTVSLRGKKQSAGVNGVDGAAGVETTADASAPSKAKRKGRKTKNADDRQGELAPSCPEETSHEAPE